MKHALSLRRLSFALLLAALASAAAAQEARHDHAAHGPKPPRYTRTVAAYAPPDVTLTDADGRPVSLASALGQDGPVLLQFIFTTCPTICPVMSSTFAAAQGRLTGGPTKARLISITIDPEQDTPERLREYARKFKAGPRWLFLTGRTEEIASVQKAFDAYRGNKMRHEPLTFLRAAPGRHWVRLDGLTSAAQLLSEYEQLTAR